MKNITNIFNSHLKVPTINPRREGFPLSGVYYWWAAKEALELLGIPLSDSLSYIVKNSKEYFLFYIGIGPMDKGSKNTLYGRIYSSHFRDSIYGSTIRYSIASLLKCQFYKKDKKSGGKAYSVSIQDEERITILLQSQFVISAIEHNRPWDVEIEYIEHYEPPINIDHNEEGWYHGTITKARDNSRKNALPK